MPDQIGKIIRIRNKFPGPPTLAVNTVGEALRRHLNICFFCRNFQPDEPNHCRMAQEMYDMTQETGVATITVRCPKFEPRDGVEIQNSHKE